MEFALQLVLTFVSVVLSSVAAYFVYLLKARDERREKEERDAKAVARVYAEKKEKEHEALKNGVTAILRDRLMQTCEYYATQGWIPVHSFENVVMLYTAYHDLGGNGIVSQLYDTLQTLPHIPPKREEKP